MMRFIAAALALTLVLGMSRLGAAEDTAVDLKVGEKAPAFEAQDDQGKPWKSADHVGKKIIVVYFYPADFTGGCTKQACGFRDDMQKIAGKDVEVVGISGDSAKNHEMFKKHHMLNFTLLADENGAVAKKFGVPLKDGGEYEVKELGTKIRRGVTASRWTFVIDKDGKIAHKNTKVNAAQDSKDILQTVEKLSK